MKPKSKKDQEETQWAVLAVAIPIAIGFGKFVAIMIWAVTQWAFSTCLIVADTSIVIGAIFWANKIAIGWMDSWIDDEPEGPPKPRPFVMPPENLGSVKDNRWR